MLYVIYHKDTTVYLPTKNNKTHYETERAAKGAITRAFTKGLIENKDDYAITDAVNFGQNVEKQVEVRNIMSGKIVMESANTPYFMSVGSETYWSA